MTTTKLEMQECRPSAPTQVTAKEESNSRKQPDKKQVKVEPIEDHPHRPTLWFSPTAWIKLNWLAHAGDTEIGGFALVPDPEELLITDFQLIKQSCTAVTVAFEDEAVADYFEHMVDAGHQPDQFARLWIHSHPSDCPNPSSTDEATFRRVFGRCDWAIMFIVARGGQTYARLRFSAGPGGQMIIPVGIRWDLPVGELDEAGWIDEYFEKVNVLDDLAEWWNDPSPRLGLRVETPAEKDDRRSVIDMPWSEEEVLHGYFD